MPLLAPKEGGRLHFHVSDGSTGSAANRSCTLPRVRPFAGIMGSRQNQPSCSSSKMHRCTLFVDTWRSFARSACVTGTSPRPRTFKATGKLNAPLYRARRHHTRLFRLSPGRHWRSRLSTLRFSVKGSHCLFFGVMYRLYYIPLNRKSIGDTYTLVGKVTNHLVSYI